MKTIRQKCLQWYEIEDNGIRHKRLSIIYNILQQTTRSLHDENNNMYIDVYHYLQAGPMQQHGKTQSTTVLTLQYRHCIMNKRGMAIAKGMSSIEYLLSRKYY